MLPEELRTGVARLGFGVLVDSIILLEDMDPETRSLFEKYEIAKRNDDLRALYNGGASEDQIKARREFLERYGGWISQTEYDTRFHGFISGKKRVSDHVLGERLAILMRKGLRLLDVGEWSENDCPFIQFTVGFSLAYPVNKKYDALQRCFDSVYGIMGDDEQFRDYWERSHANLESSI